MTGKRACVFLPDQGAQDGVVDVGHPIGETGAGYRIRRKTQADRSRYCVEDEFGGNLVLLHAI